MNILDLLFCTVDLLAISLIEDRAAGHPLLEKPTQLTESGWLLVQARAADPDMKTWHETFAQVLYEQRPPSRLESKLAILTKSQDPLSKILFV
jgi:hypothetical protein